MRNIFCNIMIFIFIFGAKVLYAGQTDFIERQHQELQKLIKKYAGEFVYVKAGTFMMGSSENEIIKLCKKYNTEIFKNERQHSVTITKNYYIGKYEVTVEQFKMFIEQSGYKTDAEKEGYSWILTGAGRWQKERGIDWRCGVSGKKNINDRLNHSVIHISYNDAIEYCKWLTKIIGKEFRLPTEAEWEYAACGGNKSKGYIYSGSNNIDEVAWYWNNSENRKHLIVGQKKPNELGIYDMSGNVWEWCQDWYGDYTIGSVTNPTGANIGSYRITRGGDWSGSALLIVARDDNWNDSASWYCRSAFRGGYAPLDRYDCIGLRLVLVGEQ